MQDGIHSALPNDVPKGSSVSVPASILAPSTAGQYTLRFDMIHEKTTPVWFSSQLCRTYDVAVTVVSAVSPSCNIASPVQGQSVSGGVIVAARVAGMQPTGVEFYIDGVLVGTDASYPYEHAWNTLPSADGSHALRARALGVTNVDSPTVQVTVNNALTPRCSIASPTTGQVVSGQVSVTAMVSGMSSAVVEFLADGEVIGTDGTEPYQISWDTAAFSVGTHVLSCRTMGTITIGSDEVQVIVGTASTDSVTLSMSGPASDGTITVTAAVNDMTADIVEFYVDDVLVSVDTAQPFTTSINTSSYTAGMHAITARAISPVSPPLRFELGGETTPSSSRMGLESFWHYVQIPAGSGTAYLNVANGNLVYQNLRLALPGKMSWVTLRHNYNSMETADSAYGKGWT